MQEERDYVEEGKRSYQEWRDSLMADPEFRAIYEEEAAKKELWLQLVEARQRAGITQAELAKRLATSVGLSMRSLGTRPLKGKAIDVEIYVAERDSA